MRPRIEIIKEKKLVGMSIQTNLLENVDKTVKLWRQFMPRKKEINEMLGTEFYSVQVYDKSLEFEDFNQETNFEKWAAVEVSNFDKIPLGMEKYLLSGGKYAVFIHKGAADTFYKTSNYIFETWLPNSDYELDNRNHFEILGAKYKANDPNSEEEVWIPIK